ncbi:GntR family transcriptional regulator [Vallitalea maricola]|uniref:GntR family transcriptional regulator n=1 Tax=Vallitalea maricola TaxID=3074433 RepID=A0ACB5UPD9_9FIRM|nr:GntR family transcriptional regulator [Vallitalea sp. AN17-2]
MDDKLKVNLNEYLPLRDVVFNTLREAILKGELVAGERLMEKQLAERMGVSRTPIREAIRKLELEGLVVMIPRKGAEVAKITHKDIKDVLEVRAALEELAVKIACEKMSEESFVDLKRTTHNFQTACEEHDIEQIIKKDVEFHDIIFNSTENEKLIQIINNLREQIYRYRVEYIRKVADFGILVKEHDLIVKSIENRDVDEARKIALQHIVNQEIAVIEIFDKKNK